MPLRAPSLPRALVVVLGLLSSITAAAFGQPPLVFTHTKSALPGDMIVIHGARFIQGTDMPEVWFDTMTGDTSPPSPTTQSTEVVSQTATLLHVRVPESLSPGLYAVFVKRGAFTSAPLWINRADAWQVLDLAGTEIDPGRPFRLYGWNLELSGAASQVWFENIDTLARTAATVTALDRANLLQATAPATLVPGQSYRLIVSNGHGGAYGETAGPVLSCLATPVDALGLGVPWADEYAFAAATVINVKAPPFNAVGDGIADDSAAIQAACDAATAAGGAQVYFPAGTYNLGSTIVRLGARIVLRGDGPAHSTIHGEINPKNSNTSSHLGIADLRLTGGRLRMNSKPGPVFAVRSEFDVPGGSALDVQSCTSKALVRDCSIIARSISQKNVFNCSNTRNLLFKDNYMQWSDGRIYAVGGRDLQIDGSVFMRTSVTTPSNGVEYGGWALDRASNVAVIDNSFGKIGSGPIIQSNDGETILNQSVPRLGFGAVGSATANTLTDGAQAWTTDQLVNEDAHVLIVSGPGEGQWRHIVSHTSDTLTLDTPWDIVPTTASGYVVTRKDVNWLVAGNLFEDCPRPIWLYSCTMADVAIVDNHFVNSGDIYLRSDQRQSDGRHTVFHNVLIQDNEIVNTNHVYPSQLVFQATVPGTGSEVRLGNGFWDVVVRHNTIDSLRPSLGAGSGYGVVGEGYFAVTNGNGSGLDGREGIKGLLFDRNAAWNLDHAYHTSTGVSRTTIHRPAFANIGSPLHDFVRPGATQGALDTVVVAGSHILDNTDHSGLAVTGLWTASTSSPGYVGPDYQHDRNADKGAKTFRYTPELPQAGSYAVYARWAAHPNRASNAPYTIVHASGSDTVSVNQRINGGVWQLLGVYSFAAGSAGHVTLGTASTDGFVIADAVRFVGQ